MPQKRKVKKQPKKRPKTKKETQKQKQKQSQKIVINLAAQRKSKPRTITGGNTSRVLNQFIQPIPMMPTQLQTIYPVSLPRPLVAEPPVATPSVTNQLRERPKQAVERKLIDGKPLVEDPLVRNVMEASRKADELLRRRRTPPSPVQEGRALVTPTRWGGRAVSDLGISSLTESEGETSAGETRSVLRRQSSAEEEHLSSIPEATSPFSAAGFEEF